MRQNLTVSTCAAIAVFGSLALAGSAHSEGFVIGGFSLDRGGALAIAGGTSLNTLRVSIASAFPGTTFSEAAVLTPEYLNGINVLFLSSAAYGNAAIVPLSTDEVSAVRAFIEHGGSAILAADNDSFAGGSAEPSNESVVDAVGLDVVGTGAAWPATGTIPNPGISPVTNGPFGTATSWLCGWSGWFNLVPAGGVVLGTVDESGLPGLVVFPRHSLAACSGAVLAMSDSTGLADGAFAPGSGLDTVMLNTLAYIAAPSCAVGLCGDIDGSGNIDGADLGALLAAWGSGDRSADLDASGSVDGADLGILLSNWGPCSN